MNNVDTLVREFRSTLPTASPAPPHVVARSAIESPRRARATRTRRVIGVGLGGVATAALASVVIALFVAGGDRVIQTATPRADWGLTVALRIEPDPGLEQQTAMDQVARSIKQRGESQHIDGLRVEQTSPDNLTLQIPGAKWEADYMPLTQFTGIAAYQSPDIVRSGNTLRDFADTATQETPDTLYAFGPEPAPGAPDPIVGTESRVAEEAKQLGDAAKDYDRVALPPNTVLLVRSPEGPGVRTVLPRLILVRDDPLFRSGDIEDLALDGSRMVATIRPSARDRISQALEFGRTAPRAVAPVVLSFSGGPEAMGVVGYVNYGESAADGSKLVIDGDGENPARRFEGVFADQQPVGVRVVVASTASYGEIPPLVGDQAEIPAWLEQERRRAPDFTSGGATLNSVEIPRASILRVLTAEGPNGTRILWAGRAPDGSDTFWLANDRTTGPSGMSGACDPGPGAWIVRSCGNTFGTDGGTFIGRVSAEVTAVTRILADGSRLAGTVKNGWYVILGGPSDDTSVTMVAMDAATGAVLATTDGRGWRAGP